MKLAERMDRILIESAFEVLVRARALEATGRNVIHLEIGEPDFPTPAHIVEAAKKALDEGWTHYGPTQGYPELREAVAAHFSATRGIRVGAQHVSIVPGGKPIIFFPMLALLEPGDEVIYPDPGFPIYQSMIQFLGATPVPIPLLESRGFSFDLDVLRNKLSSKTKMLVLNSPQNPTGGVIPADEIRIIADLVRERDLIVLSDEIYTRIHYGERPASIASLPGMLEKTIILDGFSKTYAMTGWRVGYAIGPRPIIDAMSKLQSQSTSNTNSIAQKASIAALTGSQDCVEEMCKDYISLRDQILRGFSEIPGITCARPEGAFYVYPNVSQFFGRHGMNSAADVARKLLHEAHVVTVPAEAFGTKEHVRLSYAVSHEEIDKGLARMKKFFASI